MDERLASLIINYEPEDNSPECINFGKEIAKA